MSEDDGFDPADLGVGDSEYEELDAEENADELTEAELAAGAIDDDVFADLPAAIQEHAGGKAATSTDDAAGDRKQLEKSRSLAAVTDAEVDEVTAVLPVFDRLEDWVEDFVRPLYERDLRKLSKTWCPKWWLHPEAYMILDAMWRAWEYYRHIPGTGELVWLSDAWMKFMPVLTDPEGPFHGCRPDHHATDRESVGIPQSVVMPSRGRLEQLYEQNGRALQLARLEGAHTLFLTNGSAGGEA